jgi:metallophosphoesterase (TIGR03768 family)
MLIDRNASLNQRGFYMGSMDGRTRYGDVIGAGPAKDFTTHPQVPAADPDRRSLSTEEWLGEFFNTTSEPQGHGFNRTDASAGFACYSFEPKADIPIKVIVLDDTLKNSDPAINSYELASLDEKRYNWLVSELDAGQAEGKLMIISAHIPIRNEPPGPSRLWSTLSPASEQTLVARLHTYPNLILWMSGHTHQNTVTAMPSPDPIHPELGFWVVETASLRDFPQQFRTFDIVRNSDNTISVFTTDVDPAVRSRSLAETSRSYAVASHELFNTFLTGAPGGSYNAELVKELTPEMQVKIQNLGTLAGR